MAKVRIGISGWRYASWRGVFYPAGLPLREELAYAARHFPSIELNASFYRLQSPASYARWYRQTPRGFRFAVKAPRFITHVRRLRNVDTALANFLASGLFELREKLGPILWQCPPTLAYDGDLLETFLAQLPHDGGQAAAIAQHHQFAADVPVSLRPDRGRRLRHALEVRHPSFACADCIAQLRRHRVALVVADSAGRWPYLEDVTAGFMYLRLHGEQALYAGGYSAARLDDWARRIRVWGRGGQPEPATCVAPRRPRRQVAREVYCYFDNDARAHAPADAQALLQRLA